MVLHLANIGREGAAKCRRAAPRGHGPGPHIQDHIRFELVRDGSGGGWSVHFIADVAHAIYVVKPTDPHDIGSSVLVAPGTWRYIGVSPAGRGKQHPGTKGNDFMTRALRQMGLQVRAV